MFPRSKMPVKPQGQPQQPQQKQPVSVLFCCLGNICRSTMSEGVFQSLAKKPEYKDRIGRVDSCGTAAYHRRESPDWRTMKTLEAHGIDDYIHEGGARKIEPKDFKTFDFIFAMDRSNLSDLLRLKKNNPDTKAKVMLFGEYSTSGRAEQIEDPYYGSEDGFEEAYRQAVEFSENFLKKECPPVAAAKSPLASPTTVGSPGESSGVEN